MVYIRLILCCMFVPLFTSGAAHADDADDTALRVIRYSFNSNSTSSDLCLEFNKALSSILSEQNSMSVRLEDDDRTFTIAPHNLTINTSLLCLPSLQYRHEYHLNLSGVRGIHHEKLSEPYNLNFIVPDRHPTLTFATDHGQSGFLRWDSNSPTIRSINITKTHVELYHIVGSEAMLEAWAKRQQSLLAPTESTYFAHNHGELVWQDDIVFDNNPNTTQEKKIAFETLTNNFPPGLYLITASAPSVTIKPSEAGLAPQASQWFLRSNLALHTAHTSKGYYIFSENYSAPAVVSNTHVSLYNNNHHELAQATTDNQGVAFLPLPEDKINDAVTAMGQSTTGEMAFVETNEDNINLPTAPVLQPSLDGLLSIYSPGETIGVKLSVIDIHGLKSNLKGSIIRLLRPDQTIYSQYLVPDFNGETDFSFFTPLLNGVWSIEWVDSSGHLLKRDTIRTSNNYDAPQIILNVDSDKIPSNGNEIVTVKSISSINNNSVPYVMGHLYVKWINADNLFTNIGEYHFGREDIDPTPPIHLGSFITNDQGLAHLSVALHPPQDFSPSSAAVLFVKTDPAFGVEPSLPITVTNKPKNYVIGLRPQAIDGHFSENSLAHFDVVALNSEGHRLDVNDLTYQIYDEGRNFDWYQNEGNWNYKPMQHLRRLTGKSFSLLANSENSIEWPVTAGTYRLDISNDEGELLNRYKFSAGWNPLPAKNELSTNLSLHSTPTHWQKGQKIFIQFKLDKPAIIYASVASDRLHQVWHQFYNSGEHEISFVPGSDWGDTILFQIHANGVSGQLSFSPYTEKGINKNSPTRNDEHQSLSVSASANVPEFLTVGDNLNLPIMVENRNDENQNGLYSYTVSGGSNIKILEQAGTFHLAIGHRRKLNINLLAKEPGVDKLEIHITTPHGSHLIKTWPLKIIKSFENISKAQDNIIGPNQVVSLTGIEKHHYKNGSNFIFIDTSPLFDTPQILAGFLRWHATSPMELSSRLQILYLWRKTIVESGMSPDSYITNNIIELLVDLLRRQNSDGGFSRFPNQESDLQNTTAVIYALSMCTEPAATISLKRAQSWLKHRLDNNWFEENERPARAAVFAALATTGSIDKASLNYFADTSTDKKLPSIASSQLALAFSLINDREKTQFWLKAANFQKDSENNDNNMLPFLADNIMFNQTELIPSLQSLSKKIEMDVYSYDNAFLFLRTKASIIDRGDDWKLIVNGIEKSFKGISVLNHDPKLLALRNPAANTIYYSEVLNDNQITHNIESKLITRQFFRTDGTLLEEGSAIEKNQTYIVVLEGPWPKNSENNLIELYDNPYPFLTPTGCSLPPDSKTEDQLSWLKSINFTAATNCEKLGTGLSIDAIHSDASTQWKFAYFAKVNWAGDFKIEGASCKYDGKEWAYENTRGEFKVK